MKIWNYARARWWPWPWRQNSAPPTPPTPTTDNADRHLEAARDSLRRLLEDNRVPAAVRDALAADYQQVQAMLDKLEHGHLHLAAVGRVSVGKSSLLNALLGEPRFSTSPVHGETKRPQTAAWEHYDDGGVLFIDTPGLNEIDGQQREALAQEVAARCDLVLFVADGDLTSVELNALRSLYQQHRPVMLVLNKADRYTRNEQQLLLETLRQRTAPWIDERNVVACAADPATLTVIEVDPDGRETETRRTPPPRLDDLKERLWTILESEGKTLAALNASLFAGTLHEQVTQRIMATRRHLAQKLVRSYCVAKGVSVAFNPVPLADLFAAAGLDVAMVVHLARVYGLPLSQKEAGRLVQVIAAQIVALIGTVWTINVASAALKAGTGGLSTVVTAGAQGAVAYYATLIVGRAAERYLAQGKSWCEGGPKRVVEEILQSVDRESILADARRDILQHLKNG